MSKQKTFVIDRRKWLRGESDESFDSFLLREDDGKMCCLGFFAKSCGLKNDDIGNTQAPDNRIKKHKEKFPKWFFEKNHQKSKDLQSLIDINDDESIEDEIRENIIKHIFKSHNINVKFIG